MKNRAVVSERGTVTIPEPIREMANIHPGDIIEFAPEKEQIVLRHLVVRHAEGEIFMNDEEWDKFDRLVQRQLKKGLYRQYSDLERAKLHSRRLIHKR